MKNVLFLLLLSFSASAQKLDVKYAGDKLVIIIPDDRLVQIDTSESGSFTIHIDPTSDALADVESQIGSLEGEQSALADQLDKIHLRIKEAQSQLHDAKELKKKIEKGKKEVLAPVVQEKVAGPAPAKPAKKKRKSKTK